MGEGLVCYCVEEGMDSGVSAHEIMFVCASSSTLNLFSLVKFRGAMRSVYLFISLAS